jgi:phage-related protein
MEIFNIHPDIDRFVESLDSQTRGKFLRTTQLLKIKEYSLSMPYSKKIEKDIYELRIKSARNVRIFYTFHKETIMFLHMIDKGRQKLDRKDIDTARKRLVRLQSL